MHLSKVPLVICALALGVTLTIRAEDTPAQAAARAALASKLFELSADNPPITNAPPAPTVKPPPPAPDVEVTAPATKPAEPAMKPADEPVMIPVSSDDKAKAKAEKEAAKAKAKADAAKAAADAKAQKAAAKKAADQKAAEIAAAKKQVKANMEQPKPAVVETAPVTDTPAQVQAKQAMANSLFQDSSPAPTVPPTSEVQVNKPAPVVTAVVPAPAPAPVKVGQSIYPTLPSPPPLPISMEKQQKLQELLTKYRADQVTPDEYQKQRAAILNEP